MTKFYILVPVYMAERYIHRCVLSVLNQYYQNFELILVNDGSTDKSEEICREYCRKDSRIHLINQENKGALAARETAEQYVKKNLTPQNAFILYLDSDDYFELDTLEVIDKTIVETQADLVIFNLKKVDEAGNCLTGDSDDGSIEIVRDKRTLYKRVFLNFSYNSLCRKAVSIDLLKDVDSSVNVRFGEDLLRSLPFYENSKNTVFLSKVLYNYFMNSSSITHNIKYEHYNIVPVTRMIVDEFIRNENVFEEEDYAEYNRYLTELLLKEIQKIVCINTSHENKIKLLSGIAGQDLWKNVMCNNRRIPYLSVRLLSKKKYRTIFLIQTIRKFLSKVKHLIIK